MRTTKYQVTLAVDGKHAVSVQSDDPAAVTEGLVWVQKTYGQLGRLAAERLPRASGEERIPADAPEIDMVDGEPPICAVHELPMVVVNGKLGAFWSCHQKNDDGNWCSYRPD